MDLAVEAAPDRGACQPLQVHGVGDGDLSERPARVPSEVEEAARRSTWRSGGHRCRHRVACLGPRRLRLGHRGRALCLGAGLVIGGTGARVPQDPPSMVEGGHTVTRARGHVGVVLEREGPVGGSDDLPLRVGIDLEDLVRVVERQHQEACSDRLALYISEPANGPDATIWRSWGSRLPRGRAGRAIRFWPSRAHRPTMSL